MKLANVGYATLDCCVVTETLYGLFPLFFDGVFCPLYELKVFSGVLLFRETLVTLVVLIQEALGVTCDGFFVTGV